MAVVTLNRIVFEQSVGEVVGRLRTAADKLRNPPDEVKSGMIAAWSGIYLDHFARRETSFTTRYMLSQPSNDR